MPSFRRGHVFVLRSTKKGLFKLCFLGADTLFLRSKSKKTFCGRGHDFCRVPEQTAQSRNVGKHVSVNIGGLH